MLCYEYDRTVCLIQKICAFLPYVCRLCMYIGLRLYTMQHNACKYGDSHAAVMAGVVMYIIFELGVHTLNIRSR